jgi:hypothetical protein
MFLRILIIAVLLGFAIWFINNKILGRNYTLVKIIAITLLITSLSYIFLGTLSFLVEPT